MKKFISLALALMMLMTLCACGGSKESAAPESNAPEQSSSAPENTDPGSESTGASDLDTIEAGKLIMSTNAQFPPYEMVADGEGAYQGFEGIDVEIAAALADKLGLELIIDDMEFDSALMAVQERREALGYTQTELGRKIGVAQSVISEWENGNYLPKAKQLPALAKALNCTIDELLSDKEE